MGALASALAGPAKNAATPNQGGLFGQTAGSGMPPTLPAPPTQVTGGGGTTPASPIANEPVTGDTLTQYLRSMANYLGGTGANQITYGTGLTNSAANGVNAASSTLNPAVSYWTNLLSSPQAMTQAVAPTAQAINNQYDAAARTASTTLPRGGYSSSLQASLPFQKAQQIGNLYETLQPQAAAGLAQDSQLQGALAQILGQLGISSSQLGAGLLGQASNNQLQRRGQDTSQNISNLGDLTSGLSSALRSLI